MKVLPSTLKDVTMLLSVSFNIYVTTNDWESTKPYTPHSVDLPSEFIFNVYWRDATNHVAWTHVFVLRHHECHAKDDW